MTSSHSSSTKTLSPDTGLSDGVPAKPVLLIVDDDEGVRAALRVLFVSEYQLLVAESGRQGLEYVQSHPVDVAIVDLRMPKMSGIQVLENIKHIDPVVEVIIMTGLGTPETSRQAITSGAFAYMTKPFEMNECRETVSSALEHRRQMIAWRTLERELHQRRTERETARLRGEIYRTVIRDLISPLTATTDHLELLDSNVESLRASGNLDVNQIGQNVLEARKQIDLCESIIQRYRTETGHSDIGGDSADLVLVLEELKKMVRAHPAAKSNQWVIHAPEEPLLVRANGLDLLQVLINLAVNALQASERQHHVEVYCRNLPADQTLRALQSTPNDAFLFGERLAEGTPLVSVTVQDDGPGIPPGRLLNVFDRYYSTKLQGNGTGLGLSVVQRLIDENKGAIHLHSIPGEGTAFTLFLPVV